MKKLKNATVKAVFEYDYTDCVNQMIEDGAVDSKEEIKRWLMDQIVEDIADDIVNNPNCGNITARVS